MAFENDDHLLDPVQDRILEAASAALRADFTADGFYKRQPILCTAAVIEDPEDRVLLLKKKDGCWWLPGGKMELGDDGPASCLSRECWEETGLVIAAADFGDRPIVTVDRSGPLYLIGLVYRTAWKRIYGTAEIREPNKFDDLGYFPWYALPQPLGAGFQQWLVIQMRNGADRSRLWT
jgi:8-oxo-dGTP pyrophosphatase MutT (NUDIX family)